MFKRVGLALKILRELSGASQASFARKAGIGKSQLSKYENSRELPKLDSLEKALKVLNVRPVVLFYLADFLDGLGSEELILERLLVTAEAGALVSEGEQEALAKVMLDLMGLFRAQLEGRVRSALVASLEASRSRITSEQGPALREPNEDMSHG